MNRLADLEFGDLFLGENDNMSSDLDASELAGFDEFADRARRNVETRCYVVEGVPGFFLQIHVLLAPIGQLLCGAAFAGSEFTPFFDQSQENFRARCEKEGKDSTRAVVCDKIRVWLIGRFRDFSLSEPYFSIWFWEPKATLAVD